MIKYTKGHGGLLLLCRFAGTSWPAGIIPGLVSAGIGFFLSNLSETEELITDVNGFVLNPYPFQLFAYLVGFVLVFRTNFGYMRYWEAMDDVTSMGSKWLDAAAMTIVFDAPGSASQPFLQSSVAPMDISEDYNDMEDDDDTLVRQASAAEIHREESTKRTMEALNRGASVRKSGEKDTGAKHQDFFVEVVHLFSLMHALALQHLRHDSDLGNLEGNVTKNLPRLSYLNAAPALTVSTSRIASFGNFWQKKRGFKQDDETLKLRVLGGVSETEKECLSVDSLGQELNTAARVSMVESWLMRRVTARQKHEPAGDMGKTPPPILSRMVQNISDGHYGFSQAAKVAETPFPFPYANLIIIMLWLAALFAPFVVNATLLPHSARFVVNFMGVWAYFSLAAVGDNMEDPFEAYDPNDLPFEAMHHSYNTRLLSYGVIPHG